MSLRAKKVDRVIVPGGCNKYIKRPGVSWNPPFKASCTKKYDEWLSTTGIHEETAAGNLRVPPRRTILQWIIDAWAELSVDIIKKSFIRCVLNLPIDGSQDDSIRCLQDGQPCCSGSEILRLQLDILDEPDTNPFQFEFSSSDIDEASPPTMIGLLLDSGNDEDIDIGIL